MNPISAKTKFAAVIGNPIGHSRSPQLHAFLAEQTGTDMAYLAFCAERGTLPQILSGGQAMGILGFNVTSPFKLDVMSLADTVDPEAEKMGNINTLVNRDGKWTGYNTDGEGFMMALCKNGISVQDRSVLLIGTGGTARTLSYKLAQNGAASITISSRRSNVLGDIKPALSDFPKVGLFEGATEAYYDIVINCTPLGMAPYEDKNPMPEGLSYSAETVYCDLIYNPTKTKFLAEAELAGARTMNGLAMFLYQGILAFEHFTGVCPSQEVCEKLFAEWSER